MKSPASTPPLSDRADSRKIWASLPHVTDVPKRSKASPAQISGFEFPAITDDGPAPPDTSIAVGNSDMIETVNSEWASFDKFGDELYSTDWQSFFGNTPPTNPSTGYFDGHVIWDNFTGQYVLEADDYNSIDIAASTGGTSSSSFCYINIPADISDSQFADYPQLGVSSQAIWITYNVFNQSGGQPLYHANLIAISKALEQSGCPSVTYATSDGLGDPGTGIPEQPSTTVSPAISYQSSPTGDEYMVDSYVESTSSCDISLFQVDVTDYPTFDGISFPEGYQMQFPSGKCYSQPSTLAPQVGSSTGIETGDDSALQATYFDSHLYFGLNTSCQSGSDVAVCAWVDIMDPDAPADGTQVTFGSANGWWWFPAFAPEANGNGVVATAFSNSTQAPEGAVTGITASGTVDPGDQAYLSTTPYTDPNAYTTSCPEGAGSGAGTTCYRWGDFSGASLDPSATNETWEVAEYTDSSGTSWDTVIFNMSE